MNLKLGSNTLMVMLASAISCSAQYDTLKFWNGETLIYKEDTVFGLTREEIRKSKELFHVVESQAQFPGGMEKFYEYIGKNMILPKKVIETNVAGSVNVAFTITKYGLPSRVVAKGDTTLGRGKEAIRLIETMPRWIPGMQHGRLVPMRLAIQVAFDPRGNSLKRK